ncbi:hypothetical protein USB125703_00832 [Pseudoclavibacter triregionum]|nr:hypothetical protein USB125703_00832 [Pseudoclavibacter triregionum]
MDRLVKPALLISLMLTGAIFGFFYAWFCSTLWGLDDIDPRVAMESMQAMNATVRNFAFFPIFFLPPLATGLSAVVTWLTGARLSTHLLAAATVLYLGGCLILTSTVNVPMNEALAATPVPADEASARAIWQEYSSGWQFYNGIRTVAAGVCMALVSWAALSARPAASTPEREQSRAALAVQRG